MVEVIGTDEFRDWYNSIEDVHAVAVAKTVGLLEQQGLALGHPYSSNIRGSKYPLRELRTRSHGRYLRVFYAFDPIRNAVLLIGGDKTGKKRFYEQYIPRAEKIWETYLQETERK